MNLTLCKGAAECGSVSLSRELSYNHRNSALDRFLDPVGSDLGSNLGSVLGWDLGSDLLSKELFEYCFVCSD